MQNPIVMLLSIRSTWSADGKTFDFFVELSNTRIEKFKNKYLEETKRNLSKPKLNGKGHCKELLFLRQFFVVMKNPNVMGLDGFGFSNSKNMRSTWSADGKICSDFLM